MDRLRLVEALAILTSVVKCIAREVIPPTETHTLAAIDAELERVKSLVTQYGGGDPNA